MLKTENSKLKTPLPSAHDLTVPVSALSRDGFENRQFAPFERAPLEWNQQRVKNDRSSGERSEYNILDGEALRELCGDDRRGGRDEQHDEERYEQNASDAGTIHALAELDAHGKLQRQPV